MPVADKVVLARGTLDLIGSNAVLESFTEDSTEARKMKLFYPQVIEETLEAFDWSFARKTELLAASAEDPINSWIYRYDEPSDCIVPRRILSPLGRKAKYPLFEKAFISSGKKTILTDIAEAKLQFTANITSTGLFSPLFVAAARHLLGYYVAPSLLGRDRTKTQNKMLKTFETIIKKAADSDSNTEKVEEDQDPEWISSR